MMDFNFDKVVIWGYPKYSHTHSFVHYGWYKAFKALGFDTYWFHNLDYPKNFDYSKCLFITEGYSDEHIPIYSNSIYCVHLCHNPKKYVDVGARLIDLRFNVRFTQDYTYDYVLDKSKLKCVDEFNFYESNASDLALREKYRAGISNYEAFYLFWATDLLSNEIKFEYIDIPKESKIYYNGTYWTSNSLEIDLFSTECRKNGIDFELINPWKNAIGFEQSMKLIQKSYIAPDIRGSGLTCADSVVEKCNHLSIGYIPCRIFKNISYGQIGITNSDAVYELFSGNIVYNSNVSELFYDAIRERNNKNMIREQMNFVRNNHTYTNRIYSLLKVLNR